MSEARVLLLSPQHDASETEFQPGEALPLAGPAAWRIVAGRAEVYGAAAGRKLFLAEFGAGALVFGGAANGGPPLAALFPDGGRVTAIDVSDPPPDMAARLDGWVDALSRGLALLAPDRPADAAAPDQVDGDGAFALGVGQAVTAARGIGWLTRQDGGTVDLVGVAPVSAAPLTPATWAVADRPGAGLIRPSAWLVQHPAWPGHVAAFGAAAARALALWSEVAEAREQGRVAAREAQTFEGLLDAQQRLAAVLSGAASGKTAERDDVEAVLARVLPGVATRPAPADANRSFAATLEARGLRARDVMLTGDWWRKDRGRLAAVRSADGRPCALVPDWRGRYRLFVEGERPVRVTAAVAATLDPLGFHILAPFPNRELRLWDLVLIGLALCRAEIGTLVAASVATSLLGLALPVATASVIDTFVPNRLAGSLVALGLGLAVLTVCNGLVRLTSDLTRLRMDGRLSAAIQAGVMDRLLRMPSSFMRSKASADLALRVFSIESLRRLLTGTVVTTLLSGVFGLSSAALLTVYSPLAAAAAVVLAVGLIGSAALSSRAQLKALTQGEAMTANVSSLTLQLIQNVSTLRSFAAERRLFVVWARNVAEQRARGLRSRRFSLGFEALLAGYDTAALAAAFAILGYAASADRLSTGAYVAFLTTFGGFLASAEGVARALVQVLGAKPSAQRAALLLGTSPETIPSAADPGRLTGAVEVSHVSFRYAAGAPLILDDLSLSIEAGRFVAIVGPSGSGKSTLINMITGLDMPEGGAVLFDGRDLAGLDRAAVRRQIGIVRQSGKLIAASLYENIIGLHGGTIDDAWAAAERANVAADIRALPMGLHTVVSEGVSTFSGGQVQRLLLARALAGDPQILILDEATSALDNPTQEAVMRGIDGLGITRIVIAHRLSSIRRADRIYFLEGGHLVEAGTFDGLMAERGRFAQFATRQLL